MSKHSLIVCTAILCSALGAAQTLAQHISAPAQAGSQSGMAKDQSINAGQVIELIRTKLAVTLPTDTVDTLKAGDPATVVTRIASTFTPTMAVLKKAIENGDNLIVTHEPTFYNHLDERAPFIGDPVYEEKDAYIRAHHLVLFRLHDQWHAIHPDGVVHGWVRQVGWEKYRVSGQSDLFTIPETTLKALALELQTTFGASAVRVVGDPKMKVAHVQYLPGAQDEVYQIKSLEREDVEVLVTGEVREWETVEYVRDAMLQKRHKALIMLGHEISEEAGMEECARWLRTQFPGMRVNFISAGEPYWPVAQAAPAVHRVNHR